MQVWWRGGVRNRCVQELRESRGICTRVNGAFTQGWTQVIWVLCMCQFHWVTMPPLSWQDSREGKDLMKQSNVFCTLSAQNGAQKRESKCLMNDGVDECTNAHVKVYNPLRKWTNRKQKQGAPGFLDWIRLVISPVGSPEGDRWGWGQTDPDRLPWFRNTALCCPLVAPFAREHPNTPTCTCNLQMGSFTVSGKLPSFQWKVSVM